jgi:magnesium transporter
MDAVVGDIMDTNIICAVTTQDQEEVSDLFAKYDLLSIPVVDHEHRLVGIITVDDVIDVMEQEATEDIEKMAAITPSDKPYMKMSVLQIWRHRVPWLLILMISATFTSIIINQFQDALAASVVLAAFIPMLMDSGGNSGSQASVTIIRGLSLGEIEFSDLPQVIWKETRVAILCGVTLAGATFLKLLFFDQVGLPISAVVAATLALTVLFAKIVGGILPMFAKKVGFDPAVMASPFITTIVDAISLLLYFQVARAVLHL